MPSQSSLHALFNEFPTGIIIIFLPSDGRNPQVSFSNSYARKIFNIPPSEKENDIMPKLQIETQKFYKREFDKLTEISLYDALFSADDNLFSEEGDCFFSDYNMIFVKIKFHLNFILVSIDNLSQERENMRKKLLRSISYQHLNTLHHELNNPLNNLINTVEELDDESLQRVNLSVLLIKTVIKKFILYSKNIFDDALQDEQIFSIFSLHFLFEKMSRKFKILYDYKHITFNIDENLIFLNNFRIKSEQYYLKEFIRNIFLFLYYEIPKNSKMKIKYDYIEQSKRLSMSFMVESTNTASNNTKEKEKETEPTSHIETVVDFSFDDNNKVQTIEITKEIIAKIAIILNSKITFPENCGVVFVMELSEVTRDANLSEDSSEDNVDEFETDVTKIVDVPMFSSTVMFNYLRESEKGVGKNSSKIITQNVKKSGPQQILKKSKSTVFQRKKTYDQSKLLKLKTKNKEDLKRIPTFKPSLWEKNKDHLIDNLKSPTLNLYIQPTNCSASYSRKFNTIYNKTMICEDKEIKSKKNDSRNQVNLFREKTNQPSVKKVGSINSNYGIEFGSYKTRKFPSHNVITISPMERKEVGLLNNSFGKETTPMISGDIINEDFHKSPRVNSTTLNTFSFCKRDILLVDDEDFNLITLQSCLKLERLLADTASNGEESIKKIKENQGYKLIFMDVYMPVMDGIQACKIIEKMIIDKELTEKVNVIILSAHSKETVWYQIEKLTVVKRFVQKPLTRRKLKSILQDYYY